jgi:hypothetical protein
MKTRSNGRSRGNRSMISNASPSNSLILPASPLSSKLRRVRHQLVGLLGGVVRIRRVMHISHCRSAERHARIGDARTTCLRPTSRSPKSPSLAISARVRTVGAPEARRKEPVKSTVCRARGGNFRSEAGSASGLGRRRIAEPGGTAGRCERVGCKKV